MNKRGGGKKVLEWSMDRSRNRRVRIKSLDEREWMKTGCRLERKDKNFEFMREETEVRGRGVCVRIGMRREGACTFTRQPEGLENREIKDKI